MSRHFLIRALNVCLLALTTLFCLTVLAPATALGQGKKSVAVGVIRGPGGDALRKRVLQNLKKSGQYEITDAEDIKPGGNKGNYASMAKALQVDAIVVGTISGNRDLTLNVIGPDGKVIEDVKIKGGSTNNLNKAVDKDVASAIAVPLGGKGGGEEEEEEEEEDGPPVGAAAATGAAAAGGEAEGEGEGSAEEDAATTESEEAPAAEPAEKGLRPLEFIVGARFYSRNFSYQDLAYGAVFPYKLAMAPAVIASTRIYPLAFFQNDALANIGIMGKLEVGIATNTNYQEPQPDGSTVTYQLNTGTSEWQLGLRGRLPVGKSELGIFGLYGSHTFVLEGDEGTIGTTVRPNPLVPDVDYRFLRFGFDARLAISKFTVGSHFGARFLTSMNNIDQTGWWFPGATGSGIDFGVFASYALLSFMDVAVGGDYIRYGFDFNEIPDNAGQPGSSARVIAGGATDTYLSGWLGVILHFGGAASVGDGAVSVETESSEPSEEEPSTPSEDSEDSEADAEDEEPELEE